MDRLRRALRYIRTHRPHTERSAWRGQAVVEFAIVAPIMLLLLGAALDMGRLFYARVAIENAAREGAFYGSTNPRCDTDAHTYCADPDTADWRVRNEVTGLDSLNVSFGCSSAGSPVSVTNCQAGDVYQATVSTTFDLMTPLLMPILGTSMSLDASASAVVLNDAFDPNASPAPSWCSVPNLIGLTAGTADDHWGDAGFDTGNFDKGSMKNNDIVATQSIPAGSAELCLTTVITVSA
jgi:Flp pilus assembly protein TadG